MALWRRAGFSVSDDVLAWWRHGWLGCREQIPRVTARDFPEVWVWICLHDVLSHTPWPSNTAPVSFRYR